MTFRCAARSSRLVPVVLGLLVLGLAGCSSDDGGSSSSKPNILFVIMDDIGIDQMEVFGYGGDDPPSTPNIAELAAAGIRFQNTWAMPACSTSRAALFSGRFPFRTNVLGALGPDDLANSMVSPYEMTVPKLLATKGYRTGLFGKFHIGLQDNNPAGLGMPHDLGWDYFQGWLDETGDPSSIDTTAGGVAAAGTWSCGFVPGAAVQGADSGACYMADGSCTALNTTGTVPPGRTCRDNGGILVPGAACQSTPPDDLDFETLSGHYVGPLVINHEDGSVEDVPPTDPRARRFRAVADVDAAVTWIKQQPAGKPWMATVSFASAHTPLMQPPADASSTAADSNLDCADGETQSPLQNAMVESIDTELGRLLVELGLAQRAGDGSLIYSPAETDTMVILVGDNGTLAATVKQPFDSSRAKGTAYQTGVWVPLVIAGPLVENEGRVVTHMVNTTDLYELFGEIAGIDVHSTSPRPIDSASMLPYLTNPLQESIRAWNFTQIGVNLQADGAINGPCVIAGGCTQIPVTKSVCEDNNGVWWGDGLDPDQTGGAPVEGFTRCCNVNAFRAANQQSLYGITPETAVGIRNDHYKIVQNLTMVYGSQEEPCLAMPVTEFYEINEAVPVPLLDTADKELPLDALTSVQQQNYNELSAQLEDILNSEPACPGDGNTDLVVNNKDLDDWEDYSDPWGLSSVYDLNLDGFTDETDQAIIEDNLGADCRDD